MNDADIRSIYDQAVALLQRALALCDDAEIGRAAAPHLDLALNLLQAEASKAPAPAAG